MNFDTEAQANKSPQDRTLKNLIKSPNLMISAFGISKTIFLPSNGDKLCDRLTILLQEKKLVIILIKLTKKLLLYLIN